MGFACDALVVGSVAGGLVAKREPLFGGTTAFSMGGNYPGPGIILGPAMTFGWIAGWQLSGASD